MPLPGCALDDDYRQASGGMLPEPAQSDSQNATSQLDLPFE